MMYKFKAYGHENITAEHKTTLEFTKDKGLTLKGDCIIGVRADFSLEYIKKFIENCIEKNKRKIKIVIEVGNNEDNSINKNPSLKKTLKKIKNDKKMIKEGINAEINPDFNSNREMVIRKSGFKDGRTFAIRADKGANDLDRGLIGLLVENKLKIEIILTI